MNKFARAAWLALGFAAQAWAQCSTLLTPPVRTYTSAGTHGVPARSVAVVDHDGSGPMPPVVYRSWSLTDMEEPFPLITATSLGYWPTLRAPELFVAWQGAPGLLGIQVSTSNIPAGTLLILGAATHNDQPVESMVQWDGSTSRSVGPVGYTQAPRAWTTWDPDGAGTARPLLIVGGSFTTFRGCAARNVAFLTYDGEWQALGQGIPAPVRQLLVHDFDGPGPQPPSLVAITDGASTDANAWAWDSSQWLQLDAHFDGIVCSHDADGAGPNPPYLYSSGPAGVAPPAVKYWNGADQVAVVANWPTYSGSTPPVAYDCRIFDMQSYDPDGDGPALPQLVIGGDFFITFRDYPTFAVLQGPSWQFVSPGPLGAGSTHSPGSIHVGIRQMSTWDPDGDGPLAPTLYMAGGIKTLDGIYTVDVVAYDGSKFAVAPDFDGAVDKLFAADLDGPGPAPRRLFASGRFLAAGGVACAGLSGYSDGAFHGLGNPAVVQQRPNSVLVSTNEGGVDELFTYGMSTTTQSPLAYRFDGNSWLPFGQAFAGSSSGAAFFRSMCRFDPDGPGPQSPTLFASGFTSVSSLLRWNGSEWVAAGAPRPWDASKQLVVAELDGDPRYPELCTLDPAGIMRWNGADWDAITGPLNYSNDGRPYMVVFDSDGNGPLPPQLTVCTASMQPAGYPVMTGAVRWDGARWWPLVTAPPPFPPIIPPSITYARVVDLDGDGPEPESLIAFIDGLYALRGGKWVRFYPYGSDVIGYQPGVEGPQPGELFVCSSEPISSSAYKYFLRRIRPSLITPIQQPKAAYIRDGETVTFSIIATNTDTYRWRRNGVAINNGPQGASGGGGVVSGATSPTLTITNSTCRDAGVYDCVLTRTCMTINTDAVRLSFNGCSRCGADLNGDGVQDQTDVATLVDIIAGRPNPYTFDPDFNQDGNADQDDIAALIHAIAGGNCP